MNNINFTNLWISLCIDTFFTFIAYTAIPIMYWKVKKTECTKEKARKVCIINGIVIFLLFSVLHIIADDPKIANIIPAFLWSSVAYSIIGRENIKAKKENNSDENDLKIQENSSIEKNYYCTNCGKKVNKNWEFCKYCGNKLK